ncbi:arylsulfotransferase family protein [Amycolatopsis nigrescens]|uniref:arylsulfotransferase family protein n=1 Tax=Amycolatopsis nigrescens TaxID=381445 RepID=UPI0003A645EE|nr:arylsulfotransferase family protein [Amycolatopsis nigrescens]
MPEMDRRKALRRLGLIGAAAGAGAAGLATGSGFAGAAEKPGASGFAASVRPAGRASTTLEIPQMTVLVDRPEAAPGLIYYNADGMVIADRHGVTKNFLASPKICSDFRPQTYQGRRVLTWWEQGDNDLNSGGTLHRADLSFTVEDEITEFGAFRPGMHEFAITPQNTALLTIYQRIPYDLRPVGGPAEGLLTDSLWVEVDLASRQVLNQWRASDHVPITDTYARLPTDPAESFDYFHINSVSPDVDGNILICARHTSAIYKTDRRGHRLLWTMGGKSSDYRVDGDASFSWQHDAQAVDAFTIRLFDNASDGTAVDRPHSRVIWVRRDPWTKKVSLVREWIHPEGVSSYAMGNAQKLANGNTFVGWGSSMRVSEVDRRGRLVFDATLPDLCYRGYRFAD